MSSQSKGVRFTRPSPNYLKSVVTTHQRGSTVILNITVIQKLCQQCHHYKMKNIELNSESAPIKVGDWALLVVKCKNIAQSTGTISTAVFDFSVRMLNNENTRKCRVQVTCENFSKSISLFEEWAETIILTRIYNLLARCYTCGNTITVNVYTTKVIITVLEDTPMPMIANKQLYEDVESTDFQLQTTDGTVDVHKAVLFIQSDMFRTVFRGEWKETGEGRIEVDGVTAQTLQHLKDYMYLGTLPDEGLEPLLVFAARYMMDNLREACIAKLVKTMKPENFDDIVELAALNNLGDLVRALITEIPDDVINKVHEKKNTNKN